MSPMTSQRFRLFADQYRSARIAAKSYMVLQESFGEVVTFTGDVIFIASRSECWFGVNLEAFGTPVQGVWFARKADELQTLDDDPGRPDGDYLIITQDLDTIFKGVL